MSRARIVSSMNCSIWPLAMPHFSDSYAGNHPVSHHHKKPSMIMPSGTENSKAFGVWEGPELMLPRSPSFWFSGPCVFLGKFNPHVFRSLTLQPSKCSFIRAIWYLRSLRYFLFLSFLNINLEKHILRHPPHYPNFWSWKLYFVNKKLSPEAENKQPQV